ncbi:AAA family ATPase [Glycomyces rhizosphaerae]|uniref:ATP/GTP-binding protein n=1 Tax=Glycomyces rhizosphaerae TaxID=2054422 RepID=A0ABV7PXJ7_9ACTN
MLISFKVSNYKSLRDPQELSMLPSRSGSDFTSLPVAAVYGANASGKSNLIEALSFANRIAGRWSESLHRPFRLDQTSIDRPTTYEIESELDGVRYEYHLSVSPKGVEHEHLNAYPQGRKRVLLDRVGEKITIGASMTNRSALQSLSSETPSDTPTLGMADTFKATEWQPFWQWLQTGLRSTNPRIDPSFLKFHNELPDAVERHPVLVKLAKVADLGIIDMRVVEAHVVYLDGLPESGERAAAAQATEDMLVYRLLQPSATSLATGVDTSRATREVFPGYRRVEFIHRSGGAPLSEGDESRGTIAFLLYMARILDALRDGAALVIDEFDTSLHPRIIPRIIELFQDPRTNPKNAQLIFSTHDATLLGTSFGEPILKRDEVWFVEKHGDGASELYPLTSFKPRKEHNLERHYLGGSYGGVPDIHPESLVDIVAAANKTE